MTPRHSIPLAMLPVIVQERILNMMNTETRDVIEEVHSGLRLVSEKVPRSITELFVKIMKGRVEVILKEKDMPDFQKSGPIVKMVSYLRLLVTSRRTTIGSVEIKCVGADFDSIDTFTTAFAEQVTSLQHTFHIEKLHLDVDLCDEQLVALFARLRPGLLQDLYVQRVDEAQMVEIEKMDVWKMLKRAYLGNKTRVEWKHERFAHFHFLRVDLVNRMNVTMIGALIEAFKQEMKRTNTVTKRDVMITSCKGFDNRKITEELGFRYERKNTIGWKPDQEESRQEESQQDELFFEHHVPSIFFYTKPKKN